MPNQDLKIAVMIGSIRKERQTAKPAKAIINLLKERGLEPLVLDLQEMNLPIFDDGLESEARTKLLDIYQNMDGMIMVVPEYNHSVPGVVKNAIDFARDKELILKPMSVVSTSAGVWGGVRMVSELHTAWLGVGGLVIPLAQGTPSVHDFDENNPPENWLLSVNKFLDKSIEVFAMIKAGKASQA